MSEERVFTKEFLEKTGLSEKACKELNKELKENGLLEGLSDYYPSTDCHRYNTCTAENPNCGLNFTCYLIKSDEYNEIIMKYL